MRRATGLIILAATAVLASSAMTAQACDREKSAKSAAALCDTKSCPASACASHGVTAAKKSAVTRSASAIAPKKAAQARPAMRTTRDPVAATFTAAAPARATSSR